MKFVNNFEDWARMEYMNFVSMAKDAYIKNLFGLDCLDMRYEVLYYGRKTIIIDKKTGKIGTARCREGDKFSPTIGAAIAWARLKNEEIPVERIETTIKNLKTGDKFIFLYGNKKVYTFIYYYNVNSIKRCFCSADEDLTESFSVDPGMKVIKL